MPRHIGAEIGMLNNLLRRQMACVSERKKENQVTGMQGMLLRHLSRAEEQGRVLFQKDIETEFQMRRSTATGILKLMEQHGLISREPVAHDARLKRLVLTDKARELDEEINRTIAENERILRQGLTGEEIEQWFSISDKIKENLEKYQGSLCREDNK